MKRKIESGRDLRHTVQCVNHPGLEPQHRLFLTVLVDYADHGAGTNARPGYAFLAKAVGKTEESVRLYARHCENLGLIKLTNLAHGKGNANVFAFCLEHSAYPDSYPGYKPKLAPSAEPISPKREGTLPQAQSRLAPNVGLDPHTALHITTPTTTRLGETQPSNATADPVVVVSSDVEKQSNTVDKLVQLFVEKEGYGPKHLTRKQRAQMKQLVLAHSRDKFLAAGKMWLRASPWDAKTESHFAEFINNFAAYLALAAKCVSDAERDAREAAARDRSSKAAEIAYKVIGKETRPLFKELSADDQAKYKAILEKGWFAYDMDDVAFAAEIQAKLDALRAAELESVAVDDGTPAF
jgi:hypothetical protein